MNDLYFNPDTIRTQALSWIEIKLQNESTLMDMPHNWVLVKNGDEKKVGLAAMQLDVSTNYVPDLSEVIMASKLLKAGEQYVFKFKTPSPGLYSFICTVPGHHFKMKGVMIVK